METPTAPDGPQGPPEGLTSAQRAVWRAERLAAGADERDAERRALEARRLGEREDDAPALGHQRTVEAMLSAFPGSEVVEDWQQAGPGGPWIDRRTGSSQPDTPPGAIPLNYGSSDGM